MSWESIRSSRPVARKEHDCDSKETFDSYDIIRRKEGVWHLNDEQVLDYKISPEDAEFILAHANGGFKIKLGEKHISGVGTYDGEFMTYRYNIRANEIIIKYDLYEDA